MREHAAEGPAPEVTEDATASPVARGALLTPAGVLGLQRQAGNRVTMALLQRETVTAGTTLRTGSTGKPVLRLQMHLNLLDEVKQELEVDSMYGPITTRAVREFQTAHAPLKATGVADAATLAAVEEARAEEQDQEAIARKLFNLGGAAYERRKYGHAYGFFTRAYELSARPGVLFSRAQALRRLGGRRKEAIVLYEAVPRHRPRRPRRRRHRRARRAAHAREHRQRGGRRGHRQGDLQQGRRALRGAATTPMRPTSSIARPRCPAAPA